MRSRLSLKFCMAELDISLAVFRDTENIIAPNMQKTNIMERSRERPLRLICLFGMFIIGLLHSNAPAVRRLIAGGRGSFPFRKPRRSHTTSHYTIPFLLVSIDAGRRSKKRPALKRRPPMLFPKSFLWVLPPWGGRIMNDSRSLHIGPAWPPPGRGWPCRRGRRSRFRSR